MNYLVILCDQLRADFLSVYGCHAIPTPEINRFAAQALIYENAISPYPICVPARASLLSGLNPLQSGVLSNQHWLRPDRSNLGLKTWAEILRSKGYHTASIGKMHFHPWDAEEGFAERIIAEDKRWPLIQDDYFETMKAKGLEKFDAIRHPDYQTMKGAVKYPYRLEDTVDAFVGKSAAAFISRQSSQPFALMVGFPGPHCPYDPCEESLDEIDTAALPPLRERPTDSPPEWDALYQRFIEVHKAAWHRIDYTEFSEEERLRIRHHYAASIRQIDREIGRIIDALESSGHMDDTMIILTSDHGDFVGDFRLVGKELFYQPSIHIPLIVRPPGCRKSERISAPVELSQVTATMLAAAGELPSTWNYPPLAKALDPGAEEPRHPIFGVLNIGAMVRDGRWKLTSYQNGLVELFDLESDPAEQANLARLSAYREVVDGLTCKLNHWILSSAVQGHQDKLLSNGGPLSQSPSFAQRGWQRPYPQPFQFQQRGSRT